MVSIVVFLLYIYCVCAGCADDNVSPTTAHKSFTSSNNGILSRSGLLGQLLTGGRPCMPGPSYLPPQQPAPTAATLGMPRHQPMDTSANSYWQQHTTTPSLFNQDGIPSIFRSKIKFWKKNNIDVAVILMIVISCDCEHISDMFLLFQNF